MARDEDEANQRAVELEDRFFAVSIDMICVLDFSGYKNEVEPQFNARKRE